MLARAKPPSLAAELVLEDDDEYPLREEQEDWNCSTVIRGQCRVVSTLPRIRVRLRRVHVRAVRERQQNTALRAHSGRATARTSRMRVRSVAAVAGRFPSPPARMSVLLAVKAS